jgi:hypothetical protein
MKMVEIKIESLLDVIRVDRNSAGLFMLLLTCLFLFVPNNAKAQERYTESDPKAVKEVMAGKRLTASAAWWGFDEENSAPALQAAIRSGAKKVIVPNMGKPWVVNRTIYLESDQEIELEKGVAVVAKAGSFPGKADALLAANGKRNITIRGYGAEISMRRADYTKPPYVKGEWRHCVSILSSANVKIYGLRIAESGGDGVYIGCSRNAGSLPYSEDIYMKDVACDRNYRQGISVISVRNLLIEDTAFSGTAGTKPASGIDFEPNLSTDVLVNCTIRNCLFEHNEGYGIAVYLKSLDATSQPVSITFVNCRSINNGRGALAIGRTEGLKEVKGSYLEFRGIRLQGPTVIQKDGVPVLFN